MTAFRSIRAALPTCDTCGARGSSHRAARRTLIFRRAKSELIRLRIAEKQRQLISLDEAISTTDEMIGLVLTHMSGMAARCAGPDLALRRKIDRVVYETRVAISEAATKLADQRGEPPLDEQG